SARQLDHTARRRTSRAVGAAGLANAGGCAACSPDSPRPAVSRSSPSRWVLTRSCWKTGCLRARLSIGGGPDSAAGRFAAQEARTSAAAMAVSLYRPPWRKTEFESLRTAPLPSFCEVGTLAVRAAGGIVPSYAIASPGGFVTVPWPQPTEPP